MLQGLLRRLCGLCLALAIAVPLRSGAAEPLVHSDFSKGDFAALGWKPDGAWDVFRYPGEPKNDPGPLARFAANKPDGSLTRAFPAVDDPEQLVLSVDYGWGWGEAGQQADAVQYMLLDDNRDGYLFEVHRCKANWAVQWGKVDDGKPLPGNVWAPVEIDATQAAVRDGGGLGRVVITREAGGAWTMSSRGWNKGAGAGIVFSDATTTKFSQIVLVGTKNFDEQVFNNVTLSVPSAGPIPARAAAEFLDSIGIVTTFPDRGQPLEKTIEMVRYVGFRWVRGGIEGLTDSEPTTLQTYLDLHRETGARFSWGLVSGGTDLARLIDTGKTLAKAGALLAFEGNNEPNNWGVDYQGEKGGGQAPTWMAVAKLQRDLYQAVKGDPELAKYPVWSISEAGGQTDNVGLQYLTIPPGAGTLMSEGTRFADFANVHNYTYHPGSPGLSDNKTWNAADPTSACKVDGLFGNHGQTWAKHFRGYSEGDLLTLPRVTTETGTTIGGEITEEIQGLNLLTTYLDQYKRGWSHTSVYLLRDRTDEAGNQSFGLFQRDYSPRKAATYLHNLTTILADPGRPRTAASLQYAIRPKPATMHDLLLQKSDGQLYLVVWNERLKGSDDVTVSWEGPQGTVAVYDPTIGTEPVSRHEAATSVKLTLSDHPVVLAIPKK